jgi:integrase
MKIRGIKKVGHNRYEVRVRVTDPRTNRPREVRPIMECKSVRDAVARQIELRDELKAKLAGEAAPGRQRLRDFVPAWLDGRLAAGKLKPSSATKIALVWDLHIEPAPIADLFIDAIGPGDVERWLAALRKKRSLHGSKGLSSGTVLGYYLVLRAILTVACSRARVPNPCDGVETPAATRRRDNFLTADELRTVLAQVERLAPGWYAAVLLDAVTGLRWGELSALRWSDIDEAAGVVRVERGNFRGRVMESTKTDVVKLVPLVPEVADALRAHRRRLVAEQHPGVASGLVFPSRTGQLHRGSPLRKVLDAACAGAQLGRRVTPHGLRHTANDLLRRVASGEVVRSIVGHVTTQMTHHYSHVDTAEKTTAARKVLALVHPRQTGEETGGGAVAVADEASGTA